MASASQGQVEFSADPTNLSSFMKFHEATRSFALPVGSHGVPLDPHEGAPTASSAPQRALHTRHAPPTAARGPVAPPETPSQVRTRSTEPHGLHLRPSAGTRGPVRQDAGAQVEPNGASTPVGRGLRHPARAPGGVRKPDRCETRTTASPDAVARGATVYVTDILAVQKSSARSRCAVQCPAHY